MHHPLIVIGSIATAYHPLSLANRHLLPKRTFHKNMERACKSKESENLTAIWANPQSPPKDILGVSIEGTVKFVISKTIMLRTRSVKKRH